MFPETLNQVDKKAFLPHIALAKNIPLCHSCHNYPESPCGSHILRPVWATLDGIIPKALNQVGQHDYDPDFLLPNHLPEDVAGVLAGALGGDVAVEQEKRWENINVLF